VTIEEAIQTAIEYENKVRDTYREASEKAQDPVGKRVFKALADEEQGHVDFLNHKLEEWRKTGTVSEEDLDTIVPSPEDIEEAVQKLEKRLDDGKDRSQEVDLLRKALQVEIETGNFYKQMVQELPEEGQKLFQRFVEIEMGHEAIVQAEIDSVSGMGFWFDMAEFKLEGA
jgi:rubrerythrin